MQYGIKKVGLFIYDILSLPFLWIGWGIMTLVDIVRHFFHYTLRWHKRQKMTNQSVLHSLFIVQKIELKQQKEIEHLKYLIQRLGYVIEVIGDNVGFTLEEDEDIDYVRTLLHRL